MDKRKLVDLIDNPEEISENDLEHLEALVVNFPYCQVIHLLIAKYAHKQTSMLANQKIRRAATYTFNRNTLRKFIFENDNSIAKLNDNVVTEKPIPSSYQLENEVVGIKIPHLDEEGEADDTRSFFEMLEELDKPINQAIEANPIEEKLDFIAPIEEKTPEFEIENNHREEFSENLISEKLDPIPVIIEEKIEFDTFETTETPEIVSYFQDIESDLTHTAEEGEDHKLYESVNEGKALGLYYDGKIPEAIHMYKELMQIYPEKKKYYEEQLKDLLGNKIYLYDLESESLISEKEPIISETKLEIEPIAENHLETITPSDDLSLEEVLSEPTDNQVLDNEDSPEELSKDTIPKNTQIADNQSVNELEYEFPTHLFEVSKEYNLAVEDEKEYFANNPNFVKSDDNTAEHLWEIYHNPFEDLGEIKIELEPELAQNEVIKEEKSSELETSNTVVWENFAHEDEFENPEKLDESNNSFFDQIADNQLFEEKLISNPRAEEITEISLPLETDSIFSEIEEKSSHEDNNFIDFETAYLTESQAILFFNQGKNEEAIKIYESLIERNPQKANYYHNQINVLRGADLQKNQEIKTQNNTTYGFSSSQDELNESTALQLFTQGKTAEAILIYEQLMEKYPEKRAYFISQIEILKS